MVGVAGMCSVFSVSFLTLFSFLSLVSEFSLGDAILNASSLFRICDLRPVVLLGWLWPRRWRGRGVLSLWWWACMMGSVRRRHLGFGLGWGFLDDWILIRIFNVDGWDISSRLFFRGLRSGFVFIRLVVLFRYSLTASDNTTKTGNWREIMYKRNQI